MSKNLKKLVLISLVLMTGIFLTACGGDKTSQTTDGNTHLNFGVYNYSDSLDPATNTNSSWCGMRYGITEGLFRFSDKIVAEPNIAKSYEVSDDYKVWTLHIREDVKFSNGNPVTASAVKESIERLYRATDQSAGGKGNSTPRGYLIYESIEANDEASTVTISCASPVANMTGILSYPYFAIIDASVIDKEVIGTGPYKVKKVNSGISIELLKNENYWNGKVPYDSVNIIYADDSSTKAMALKSGNIDLAENITTASDLSFFDKDSAYYLSIAPGVRTANSYINFKGVLKNDTLRQAVMMALDKETMCEVTVAGMYTEGSSVLPSSLDYNYDKLTDDYTFNKEAAIKLLDDAGIIDTNGDGIREIDGKNIVINSVTFTSRNLDEFAEAAALQLAEIGIKVDVNVRDYDTALALLNAGEFDLWTCNSLVVGAGDPQEYLGNWYSGNSDNYGYYKNPDYDKLYEKLAVELSRQNRKEIITEMQQFLIDDLATIVYGYYNSTMVSKADKVKGAEIATMDYYWLTTNIRPAGE